MRKWTSYSFPNLHDPHAALLHYGKAYQDSMILATNNYEHDRYHTFELIAAFGTKKKHTIDNNKFPTDAFLHLRNFIDENKDDYLFGHFSYDLKNSIEQLSSNNPDHIRMPELCFFQPEIIIIANPYHISCGTLDDHPFNAALFQSCCNTTIKEPLPGHHNIVKARVSKKEYLDTVHAIKNHIQQGDIYEMNYCQEFFIDKKVKLPPEILWYKLNQKSPMPFAAFYKLNDTYLLSTSPERFIARRENKIISQPIKGTIKRGKSPEEDEYLRIFLQNNPKERSENIMIVDLVRNDLSKTAKKASVNVEALFGVYPFPNVFQMISTVTSEVTTDTSSADIIRHAFPMGSMTGAPKVKAMQLIEQYESVKRGLFSGSVGYFAPGGNFDFNVIIRSILMNTANEYLSFITGGAITNASVAIDEYEESMLKAKAMIDMLESRT